MAFEYVACRLLHLENEMFNFNLAIGMQLHYFVQHETIFFFSGRDRPKTFLVTYKSFRFRLVGFRFSQQRISVRSTIFIRRERTRSSNRLLSEIMKRNYIL